MSPQWLTPQQSMVLSRTERCSGIGTITKSKGSWWIGAIHPYNSPGISVDNHRPRQPRLTTLKQERQCFPLLLANCLKYLKNIKYS
ncbi:hypothetical protein IscW_ISCW011026 [Ixodes scapularis]|uniref:Uncharacterized protein n=1 Tax=Ixodes scapularis TaxID=6945 RepID=B7Q8X4_IXOSC|nr:hypothetical protein IscW_ISCW011026 [Ixodes scapularis]|eukprot:XP_002405475.1 hypothetical protein IscW_ISCW011026 [Ixodes scapularis]